MDVVVGAPMDHQDRLGQLDQLEPLEQKAILALLAILPATATLDKSEHPVLEATTALQAGQDLEATQETTRRVVSGEITVPLVQEDLRAVVEFLAKKEILAETALLVPVVHQAPAVPLVHQVQKALPAYPARKVNQAKTLNTVLVQGDRKQPRQPKWRKWRKPKPKQRPRPRPKPRHKSLTKSCSIAQFFRLLDFPHFIPLQGFSW